MNEPTAPRSFTARCSSWHARLTSWIGSMAARDGRPTAYVCRGFVCDAPVTDLAALEAALG